MKVGAEDKRKQLIAGVLGVVAVGAVGYQLFSAFGPTPTVAPPPPPVIVTSGVPRPAGVPLGPAAVKIGTTSAQLDPTLHEEAMLRTESLVYSGNGRNIFMAGSEPPPPAPVLVKAIAPARPVVPVQTAQAVVPQGPPPPPPINLKFFGTSMAQNGTRRAFLLNGDDVFVAVAGDVVQRRYRILAVNANSVEVEDIPVSHRQTFPLVN